MSKNNRIKIIVVTGFLGSGKTTFLGRLLTRLQPAKTGLIINDFGSIPVDAGFIKSSFSVDAANEEPLIVNIENGSIFCSCRKSAFLDGLDFFIKEKPEFLVVETSGISDPASIRQLLKLDRFADLFVLQQVVCLVSADNFREMKKRFLFIERQIRTASLIILNKCDLVLESDKTELTRQLKDINPDAELILAQYADIETDLSAEILQTMTVSSPDVIETDKLESFTLPADSVEISGITKHERELKNVLIRIKGFVKDTGEYFSVNGTSAGITINRINYEPEGKGLTMIYSSFNRQAAFRLSDILCGNSASVNENFPE